MRTRERPLMIALCGIDGVGKTTLLRKLAETHRDNRYFFVGRGPADCERIVEQTIPRTFGDWRDWVEGPFAQALAVACAFDYVAYFNRVVAPMLSGPLVRMHGMTSPEAILTDRHAVCFQAFALCNSTPSTLALQLLKSVVPPDAVLYLTAPADLIEARRAGAPLESEFEHSESQRRQLGAYEKAFAEMSCPVIRIANVSELHSTCELVMRHIRELIEEQGNARKDHRNMRGGRSWEIDPL